MLMSSGGYAASSSGCVTRPRAREIGSTGYAGPTQHSLLIGRYVMATAEYREPCDSRGSRTVLGAPGGEIPSGDSTADRRGNDGRLTINLHFRRIDLHRRSLRNGGMHGGMERGPRAPSRYLPCAFAPLYEPRDCSGGDKVWDALRRAVKFVGYGHH